MRPGSRMSTQSYLMSGKRMGLNLRGASAVSASPCGCGMAVLCVTQQEDLCQCLRRLHDPRLSVHGIFNPMQIKAVRLCSTLIFLSLISSSLSYIAFSIPPSVFCVHFPDIPASNCTRVLPLHAITTSTGESEIRTNRQFCCWLRNPPRPQCL